MNLIVLSVALTFFLCLSFLPAIRKSEAWAATVTPLASIMGSGFLISAPLLASVVGNFSPWVMLGLLLLAWCIGGAIRFNIKYIAQNSEAHGTTQASSTSSQARESQREHRSHTNHVSSLLVDLWQRVESEVGLPPSQNKQSTEPTAIPRKVCLQDRMEKISQFVLAIAYLISVTYYLQLLGEFLFHVLGSESSLGQRLVVVAILGSIAMVGFVFGLKIVERMETYAINLNLSIIVSLLVALALYNMQLYDKGTWGLPELEPQMGSWEAFRTCLGLLVIVQGFETSRFLGAEHSAALRIRTMRWAQAISSGIYMLFLGLMLAVLSPDDVGTDVEVTAIVSLVAVVAGVLPMSLTVAALGSQFSAAVADEAGCGGLLSQLFGKLLNDRSAYLVVGAITIVLASVVDVMQIVSIASRAFAGFYCIQCAIACTYAWSSSQHSRWLAAWFALLTLAAFLILVLATPLDA